MDALDKALRSLTKQARRQTDTPEEREARIALYAERVAQDKDIWTGKPRHAKEE